MQALRKFALVAIVRIPHPVDNFGRYIQFNIVETVERGFASVYNIFGGATSARGGDERESGLDFWGQ